MIIRLPIGLVGSNTYLVYDEESREHPGAIVDPGTETIERLQQRIETERIDVKYIINTHAHFDHIAANAQLKNRYPAPLVLHRADKELLQRGGGASWFNVAYVPSPAPDVLLEDGDELQIGHLHLQALHTPGHTPGSICLYVPERQALLTGDTLFPGSVGRTDLPGGDARQLTESLRRLLELPDETTLYPGHGEKTTLKRERRQNPWLRRIQREAHA
jgi:glyoxylase-like metal-dependent hydrolase (beta-lactamase superfamily II)